MVELCYFCWVRPLRYPAWLTTATALLLALGCQPAGDDSSSSSNTGSGTGGSGGTAPQAMPLSVMTWNIRTFPLQNDTVERVREIILQQNPDVLAIQEIEDPNAFAELDTLLPQYEGVLNEDAGGFLRVGLFTKRGRVTTSEVATLYTGNWYAFPRPPLKARITADGGAYDFVAVVLHLKAKGDAESQDRRREACETLDTWVQNQIASGVDTEFMLLGDFNDELTDAANTNVFSAFLDKPDSYTFLTEAVAIDNGFTYVPLKSMIDHVLITHDLLDEYGIGTTEIVRLDDSVGNYNDISDHIPVKVRLVPSQ